MTPLYLKSSMNLAISSQIVILITLILWQFCQEDITAFSLIISTLESAVMNADSPCFKVSAVDFLEF